MSAAPPLLQVTGLRKAFGGVLAVDGVDFALAPGEMLALIGPNGAGKSTTFNMWAASCGPMRAPSSWPGWTLPACRRAPSGSRA